MIMSKILAIILSISLLGVTGCAPEGNDSTSEKNKEEQTETVTPTPDVTEEPEETEDTTVSDPDVIKIAITLTDGRQMKGELYPKVAPLSVENFVKLANEDFFDGLVFHRVIEGFMIQGGGYDETFYQGNFDAKETASINGEFASNGVENNLKHTKGILSMARTNDPDSASSQFFIMHEASPHLDGDYAAFGKITEGLEIVDEIAGVKTTILEGTVTYEGMKYPTRMSDVPETPVVIKSIDIIK